MTVKIISDLHFALDALVQEVASGDTLLLLGDLINVIDYRAMDGILVDVFGLDVMIEVVALRAQRRFEDARAVMARQREGREAQVGERFQALVRSSYLAIRDALPPRTHVILGNVDSPALAEEALSATVDLPDGKVIEIEGLRVGFVGGGLPTPQKVAGEISEEEYNAKIEGLGEVDVICSHVPPDVPELTYDTLARRHERGSARLLSFIREVQPQAAFFGHIHQPLVSSVHVGRSHLLNVGYFRRTQRAWRLSLAR